MLSDPAASWFAALVLTGCSFLNSTPSLDVYSITLFVDLHVYGQRNSCMSPGGPGEHIVSEQQFSSLQGLGTHPAIKWSSSPFVSVSHYGQLQQDPWSNRKETLPPRTESQNLVTVKWRQYLLLSLGQFSFPEIKSHRADRADFKVLSSRTPVSHPAQSLDCKPQHCTQWSELSGSLFSLNCIWCFRCRIIINISMITSLFTRKRDWKSASSSMRQILSSGYCRKTGWQAGILTGAVSNSSMKCSPESDSSHPSPSEQYKLVVHSQEADWGCSLSTCLSCLSQPRCHLSHLPETCTTSSPLQTSQPFSSLSILEVWLSIIQNQTLAFLKVRMEI